MALTDKLTAIANAIRAKSGGTELLTLDEMPVAISEITGGVAEPYIKETYSTGGVSLLSAEMHGYTIVRDYLFYGCPYLSSISLPSAITKISQYAFANCVTLDMSSLPSELTEIGVRAFAGCRVLRLSTLPPKLTTISVSAFDGCYELAITHIPSGVKTIGLTAFKLCDGLTSITFDGTPTSRAGSAFDECTHLTTINVPWAEGAVANAPWGATNATINYNYTGA